MATAITPKPITSDTAINIIQLKLFEFFFCRKVRAEIGTPVNKIIEKIKPDVNKIFNILFNYRRFLVISI